MAIIWARRLRHVVVTPSSGLVFGVIVVLTEAVRRAGWDVCQHDVVSNILKLVLLLGDSVSK